LTLSPTDAWGGFTGAAAIGEGSLVVSGTFGATSVYVGGAGTTLQGNSTVIAGPVTLSHGAAINFDGDCSVGGEIMVNTYGVLTVGSSGSVATLTAPSGLMITGSGTIVMDNYQSALIGSLDDEGWQSNQIIGAIQGADNTLTIGSHNPNGTDVAFTLGQPNGPSGTGTIGNVVVTGDKLIVSASNCLADGASLSVGSDVSAYFAPVVTEEGSILSAGRLLAVTTTTSPQTSGSATATGAGIAADDDGAPSADPAVLAAQAAARAAAAAHAKAARALMLKRETAGVAAINAIADAIDPDNAPAAVALRSGISSTAASGTVDLATAHSTAVLLAACNIMFDGLVAAIAGNAGTRIGLSNSAIVECTIQALHSYNSTMAASRVTAGDAAAAGDSDNTTDDTLVADGLTRFLAACSETVNV